MFVSHTSSVLPQELGLRLVQGCFGIAFPGGLASPRRVPGAKALGAWGVVVEGVG